MLQFDDVVACLKKACGVKAEELLTDIATTKAVAAAAAAAAAAGGGSSRSGAFPPPRPPTCAACAENNREGLLPASSTSQCGDCALVRKHIAVERATVDALIAEVVVSRHEAAGAVKTLANARKELERNKGDALAAIHGGFSRLLTATSQRGAAFDSWAKIKESGSVVNTLNYLYAALQDSLKVPAAGRRPLKCAVATLTALLQLPVCKEDLESAGEHSAGKHAAALIGYLRKMKRKKEKGGLVAEAGDNVALVEVAKSLGAKILVQWKAYLDLSLEDGGAAAADSTNTSAAVDDTALAALVPQPQPGHGGSGISGSNGSGILGTAGQRCMDPLRRAVIARRDALKQLVMRVYKQKGEDSIKQKAIPLTFINLGM